MHWLARPHLFTLLFIVIFLALLERAREGRTRMLLFLPPLTILWTNLHGGFIVGLSLIGCYAAGELALWLVEQDRGAAKAALLRSKPYLFTGLACGAATLVNPYTYQLHVHMLLVPDRPLTSGTSTSTSRMFFQNNLALWYGADGRARRRGGLSGACITSASRMPSWWLGWLQLALFAVRNLPIYLLVAAPIVATCFTTCWPI